MAADMTTVGVIGLGTMGAGIVEVLARSGLEVVAVETTQELAERGAQILRSSTDKAVARGKIDQAQQEAILGRVTVTTDLAALAGAGLVVEAVPETMALKHEVFGRLDAVVDPQCILASNTSSLSITDIAAGTAHPERVVGMHFFNPAPVLRLVEVITTLRTDPQLTATVTSLAQRLGKKPVVVRDRAGFVANYLLFGYLNSALTMIEHGHVSREDIDTAMRVGVGLPMGPMTLMDLVGLDVCDHIGEVIYAHSRSPLHAPSAMLGQLVTSGMLGRKSGQGFYTYEGPGRGSIVADAKTPAEPEAGPAASVAVLGHGALANELATRLEEGGSRVARVTELGAGLDADLLGQVDVVIEADDVEGPGEDDEAEGRYDVDALFAELGELTRPGTLLATANSYAAMALGAISDRPGETVVLRAHAATPHGQVIEIGRTSVTTEETIAAMRALVRAAGAEPVVCRDRAGLVVDALLVAHLNDAVTMLDQGYASVSDIDTACQEGLGYPMGPFTLIDHIGADEVLAMAEELHASSAVPAHVATPPSPLLVEHVVLDQPFVTD